MVMEALSRTFRGGLPLKLLYADDLVLLAETVELLKEKILRWKLGLEEKGMQVNMGKTKVMGCQMDAGRETKFYVLKSRRRANFCCFWLWAGNRTAQIFTRTLVMSFIASSLEVSSQLSVTFW